LLPEVDHFVDPSEIEAIPDLIREEPPAAASEKSLFSGEYERTTRVVSTPGYAFLRISDGCSRNCSYCAIPSIRGPLQSVDINDLVDEANYLAANSVKELVIVGQDITSYGRDKSDPQALEKLLEKLETIEALEWIRLMYLHPQGISKELIRMVSESSRILPYLDIPFQHVSGKVLKAMSRPWAPGQITRLIEDLRDAIPDLTLRTTVMVGFPGEGEDEFRELLDFVREYRIDRLGIFQYYPEEGTKAFNLGDPVPGEVKRDRINKLIEVQEQIARERGLKWTGRVTKALVEGVSPESEYLLQGRVWDQAPEVDGALYITDGRALAGNFHTVRVHDSHGPDLFGEIIR
jgi:ribosomal protein S12 methylthiotransferase